MASRPVAYSTADVLAARPPRHSVSFEKPWAYFVEDERSAEGIIQPVATIFLTNRECAFHCLMCDLWKNTREESTPQGAVPEQLDFALARLPPANVIKLYNSGNFLDPRAVPIEDWPRIAERVAPFDRVIVENHPRLNLDRAPRFAECLSARLELAMGLETVHPEVLPRLNKQMTVHDFANACRDLRQHDIEIRAFILLRPPFLTEQEGIHWSLKSIAFAFDQGVTCCSVIATRGGNGIMERLAQQGDFSPPSLSSLERVLEHGIAMRRGRVFADTWEAEQLVSCAQCGPARIARIRQLNLQQTILPPVICPGEHHAPTL